MKVALFAGHSKAILQFHTELITEIISRGHEVVCIGPELEFKEQFQKIGAEFIHIHFNRHSINPLSGISIIKTLSKVLKENKIDIYYGFTAVPSVYGVISAKKAGIKNIYMGITGAGKIVQSRKGMFNKFIRIALSVMYKNSIKKCRKVFFLNDDNINYFVKHKLISKDKCVKTGGSGVNLTRFQPRPVPENDSFLFIGALLKFKGICEYMEAARLVRKEYPNSEFHIVGEIDKRVSAITQEELDEYVNDGSVICHGYQNDVKPFLNDCRYFVLPSYSEGIPTCVIEAMATGRPIITTDAPGCNETVIDGKNGFLVPVKNVEKLKEKMIYMIEHPNEIEKMAKYSRRLVEERFDVEIVNSIMIKTMEL